MQARLANVTAAVLLGDACGTEDPDRSRPVGECAPPPLRIAEVLADLFEEVLLVGSEPLARAPGRRVSVSGKGPAPLAGVVAALEAAGQERVLIVGPSRSSLNAEVLLALTAWPEHAIVAPRAGGRAELLCALYRRDDVLPPARRLLDQGCGDLEELAATCERSYLENEDLGLLDR
jgi:molybdopterin-guanine dinucleotide biosynthesis protein A